MLKGELFSTDMVRAYLDGRKKHTARPCKPQPTVKDFKWAEGGDDIDQDKLAAYKQKVYQAVKERTEQGGISRHRPGDYIYCRETWCIQSGHRFEMDVKIRFKAGGPMTKIQFPNRIAYDEFLRKWDKTGKDGDSQIWIPSIHMPREAARLFFRVTKVEVMRLDDVTEQFAQDDGFTEITGIVVLGGRKIRLPKTALDNFRQFWLDTYGPNACWMWVYWTEPCSKEEATHAE